MIDKSRRNDGTLSRADFIFDTERDVYACPQGKLLTTTGRVHRERTLLYRASKLDCDPCLLKPRCCPTTPQRKIPRDIDEEARDFVRSLASTPAFEQSRHERKRVEMLFAHRTGSVFSSSVDSASVVRAVRRMSSCSPPPHRT